VRDILGIMVDVNLHEDSGKDYLEIRVEAYPYPIRYKGEYHYRSGSTKQELKGNSLSQFVLRKQGRHWEVVPVFHVVVYDLNHKALDSFRKQTLNSLRLSADVLEDPETVLLDQLYLMEGTFLKRAAVLLFHPVPERVVAEAFFRAGLIEAW